MSKKIEIKINCEGSHNLRLDECMIMQEVDGEFNLKDLSEKDFEKLQRSIESDGVSSPFYFWEDENGQKWFLDGAQRDKVLHWMGDQVDRYKLPETYPFSKIYAKDISEAARKILIFNSKFGTITEEGLYGFVQKFKLADQIPSLKTRLNLIDIDLKVFEEGYIKFDAGGDSENSKPDDRTGTKYELTIIAEHVDYLKLMPKIDELLKEFPNIKYNVKEKVI